MSMTAKKSAMLDIANDCKNTGVYNYIRYKKKTANLLKCEVSIIGLIAIENTICRILPLPSYNYDWGNN